MFVVPTRARETEHVQVEDTTAELIRLYAMCVCTHNGPARPSRGQRRSKRSVTLKLIRLHSANTSTQTTALADLERDATREKKAIKLIRLYAVPPLTTAL